MKNSMLCLCLYLVLILALLFSCFCTFSIFFRAQLCIFNGKHGRRGRHRWFVYPLSDFSDVTQRWWGATRIWSIEIGFEKILRDLALFKSVIRCLRTRSAASFPFFSCCTTTCFRHARREIFINPINTQSCMLISILSLPLALLIWFSAVLASSISFRSVHITLHRLHISILDFILNVRQVQTQINSRIIFPFFTLKKWFSIYAAYTKRVSFEDIQSLGARSFHLVNLCTKSVVSKFNTSVAREAKPWSPFGSWQNV
jgi:hypothetical protein